MNPELKAKWVEALRSGKYKQGMATLRSFDNAYCCLGVLCDLVNPDGWMSEGTRPPDHFSGGRDFGANRSASMSGLLSPYMRELAGIPLGYDRALANMNDEGRRFPQIADYIEANL